MTYKETAAVHDKSNRFWNLISSRRALAQFDALTAECEFRRQTTHFICGFNWQMIGCSIYARGCGLVMMPPMEFSIHENSRISNIVRIHE